MQQMIVKAFSIEDFAHNLHDSYADLVTQEESRNSAGVRDYVYASGRRKCLRRMVLEMAGAEQSPFNADQLARMRRGKDRERDILTDLIRLGRMCAPGFEVEGEQLTVEVKGRNGKTVIRGKIEGYLNVAIPGGERPKFEKIPYEIKTWAPYLTDGIHTFRDVFDGNYTWSGAHQLLSYLYAMGHPFGMLVLDRPGLPLLLPVNLYDYLQEMEDFIADAEQAQGWRNGDPADFENPLPEYHEDRLECARCPLRGYSCHPPLERPAQEFEIITDPEYEALAARHVELAPIASEYDRVHKKIAARVRGIKNGRIGQFLISGSWRKKTVQEFPEDVTKQLEEWEKNYSKTVPEGSYVFEIEKG